MLVKGRVIRGETGISQLEKENATLRNELAELRAQLAKSMGSSSDQTDKAVTNEVVPSVSHRGNHGLNEGQAALVKAT